MLIVYNVAMSKHESNEGGIESPYRNLGGKYGVLTRIQLGKAALTFGVVEAAAGGASVAADSPAPIVITSLALLWTAGETIHNMHNLRNIPREDMGNHALAQWLSKEDQPSE